MRDFLTGFGYVGKGQRWVARHGRWWGFGLLPALIALVLYVAALVALGIWADDLATWATPFADDWISPWPGVLRGLFIVLLLLGGISLALLTFTAVTLLIGEPFYESLSKKVDESEGDAPDGPRDSLPQELWRSARDSLHLLSRVLVFSVPLFFLGFVPAVGQTVVPAIGFAVNGFFLTAELTGVPMERRGIPVHEGLRLLRGRMLMALGFGVPLVLLFLVPFVAVLVMPGAVAGATLLVRDLLDGSGPDEKPAPQGAEQPSA